MKGFSLLMYSVIILINLFFMLAVIFYLPILFPLHILLFFLSFKWLLRLKAFKSNWKTFLFSIISFLAQFFFIIILLLYSTNFSKNIFSSIMEYDLLFVTLFVLIGIEFVILFWIYSNYKVSNNFA